MRGVESGDHHHNPPILATRLNAICDERRRTHRKRRMRMLMGDMINHSTGGGRRQRRWKYVMGRRSGESAHASYVINRPFDASYGEIRRSPGKTGRPILSSDDMNDRRGGGGGRECLWKHRNRWRRSGDSTAEA